MKITQNSDKKKFNLTFRVLATLTAFCFLLGATGACPQLSAYSSTPALTTSSAVDLNKPFVIPSEIGRIEEAYHASNRKPQATGECVHPGACSLQPLVILIQDAHAVPEAQKSIQKLIEFFQKEYGVSLTALEGASTELDPQFFKSFPDKELLRKSFDEYFAKGELAGSTAAAIFSEGNGAYQGIENWDLYEKGLSLYLEAAQKEGAILTKLQAANDRLQLEKQGTYSKELLEMDAILELFHKNQADLASVLKKLDGAEKGTGREELPVPFSVRTLLEEIEKEGKDQSSIEREVREIAEEMRLSLRAPKGRSNLAPEIASLATLARNDIAAFNAKYQAFQTSRISPEAFALYLKELIESGRGSWGMSLEVEKGTGNTSLPVPFSFSHKLSQLMKNQKHLRDIQGTKLFKEFEQYAQSVKESLFRNEKERELDKQSRELLLLERLAKLELSREEWEEIKTRDQGQVTSDSWPVTRVEIQSHLAFYENAEKRERAFMRNFLNLMNSGNSMNSLNPLNWEMHNSTHLSNSANSAHSAILITGGFHTEGLAKQFKEKGISYAIVTPTINSIPEQSVYRQHMQGDVSWKDYFEVKNGRINPYEAFAKAVRDRLLGGNSSELGVPSPGVNKNSQLRTPNSQLLLKAWRDQIIRNLAEKEQLTKAHEYTQFLDEVAKRGQAQNANNVPVPFLHELRTQWLSNVDRLLEKLQQLNSSGQLNQQSVLNLLKPATIADGYTSLVLASGQTLSILPSYLKTPRVNAFAGDGAAIIPGKRRSEMEEKTAERIGHSAEHKGAMRYAPPSAKPSSRSEVRMNDEKGVTKAEAKSKTSVLGSTAAILGSFSLAFLIGYFALRKSNEGHPTLSSDNSFIAEKEENINPFIVRGEEKLAQEKDVKPPTNLDGIIKVGYGSPAVITLDKGEYKKKERSFEIFKIVSQPKHGTLRSRGGEGRLSGIFIYQPLPGYTGDDSFTYMVTESDFLYENPKEEVIATKPQEVKLRVSATPSHFQHEYQYAVENGEKWIHFHLNIDGTAIPTGKVRVPDYLQIPETKIETLDLKNVTALVLDDIRERWTYIKGTNPNKDEGRFYVSFFGWDENGELIEHPPYEFRLPRDPNYTKPIAIDAEYILNSNNFPFKIAMDARPPVRRNVKDLEFILLSVFGVPVDRFPDIFPGLDIRKELQFNPQGTITLTSELIGMSSYDIRFKVRDRKTGQESDPALLHITIEDRLLKLPGDRPIRRSELRAAVNWKAFFAGALIALSGIVANAFTQNPPVPREESPAAKTAMLFMTKVDIPKLEHLLDRLEKKKIELRAAERELDWIKRSISGVLKTEEINGFTMESRDLEKVFDAFTRIYRGHGKQFISEKDLPAVGLSKQWDYIRWTEVIPALTKVTNVAREGKDREKTEKAMVEVYQKMIHQMTQLEAKSPALSLSAGIRLTDLMQGLPDFEKLILRRYHLEFLDFLYGEELLGLSRQLERKDIDLKEMTERMQTLDIEFKRLADQIPTDALDLHEDAFERWIQRYPVVNRLRGLIPLTGKQNIAKEIKDNIAFFTKEGTGILEIRERIEQNKKFEMISSLSAKMNQDQEWYLARLTQDPQGRRAKGLAADIRANPNAPHFMLSRATPTLMSHLMFGYIELFGRGKPLYLNEPIKEEIRLAVNEALPSLTELFDRQNPGLRNLPREYKGELVQIILQEPYQKKRFSVKSDLDGTVEADKVIFIDEFYQRYFDRRSNRLHKELTSKPVAPLNGEDWVYYSNQFRSLREQFVETNALRVKTFRPVFEHVNRQEKGPYSKIVLEVEDETARQTSELIHELWRELQLRNPLRRSEVRSKSQPSEALIQEWEKQIQNFIHSFRQDVNNDPLFESVMEAIIQKNRGLRKAVRKASDELIENTFDGLRTLIPSFFHTGALVYDTLANYLSHEMQSSGKKKVINKAQLLLQDSEVFLAHVRMRYPEEYPTPDELVPLQIAAIDLMMNIHRQIALPSVTMSADFYQRWIVEQLGFYEGILELFIPKFDSDIEIEAFNVALERIEDKLMPRAEVRKQGRRLSSFDEQRKIFLAGDSSRSKVVQNDENRNRAVSGDNNGTVDAGLGVDKMVSGLPDKIEASEFENAAQLLVGDWRDSIQGFGIGLKRNFAMFGGNQRGRNPLIFGRISSNEPFLLQNVFERTHSSTLLEEKPYRFFEPASGLRDRIATAGNLKLGTKANVSPLFLEDERSESDSSHGSENIAQNEMPVKLPSSIRSELRPESRDSGTSLRTRRSELRNLMVGEDIKTRKQIEKIARGIVRTGEIKLERLRQIIAAYRNNPTSFVDGLDIDLIDDGTRYIVQAEKIDGGIYQTSFNKNEIARVDIKAYIREKIQELLDEQFQSRSETRHQASKDLESWKGEAFSAGFNDQEKIVVSQAEAERYTPKKLLLFEIAEKLGLKMILNGGTARDFSVSVISQKEVRPRAADYDLGFLFPREMDENEKVKAAFNTSAYERFEAEIEGILGKDTEVDRLLGEYVGNGYAFEHRLRRKAGRAFSVSRLGVEKIGDQYIIFGDASAIEDLRQRKLRVWLRENETLGGERTAKMMGKAAIYKELVGFDFVPEEGSNYIEREINQVRNASQLDPNLLKKFMQGLYGSVQLSGEAPASIENRLRKTIHEWKLADQFEMTEDELVRLSTSVRSELRSDIDFPSGAEITFKVTGQPVSITIYNPHHSKERWSLYDVEESALVFYYKEEPYHAVNAKPIEPNKKTKDHGVEFYHQDIKFNDFSQKVIHFKNVTGKNLKIRTDNLKGVEPLILPSQGQQGDAVAAPLPLPPPVAAFPPASKPVLFEPFKLGGQISVMVKIQGSKIIFIIQIGKETLGQPVIKNLNDAVFTFGREVKSSVPIDDANVSRKHAKITVKFENGKYKVILKDLESTNGTFVKQGQITEHELQVVGFGPGPAVPAQPQAVPAPQQKQPVPLEPAAKQKGELKRLEYDLESKKLTNFTYSLKRSTAALPNADERVFKALKDFNAFEDVNYVVLNLMFKATLTLGDMNQLFDLLRNMIERYLALYQTAAMGKPDSFEFIHEAMPLFEKIQQKIKSEINKIPSASRPVKASDPLPPAISESLRKLDKYLTKGIIGIPLKHAYPGEKLEKVGFHEMVNVVHQKAVRNLQYLIESLGVQKRQIKVKIRKEGEAEGASIELSYIDARPKLDPSIPLPMQHVAMAFAKGQRVHRHLDLFNPSRAEIFADDQQAGIRMKLGVHSARIQYAFQPIREKGRIVVNYQDSYENHQGSAARLDFVRSMLEAIGFKAVVSGKRLDAYYDKDSASSYDMSELPEKLHFVVQLLSAVKDWDLHLNHIPSSERQALLALLKERFLEDGYIGPGWQHNPAMLEPKIGTTGQQALRGVAQPAGIELQSDHLGQRDIDWLMKQLSRLQARGAVTMDSKGIPVRQAAYDQAAKESPIKTFLKMLESADHPKLESMRKMAAIAKTIENFGEKRVIAYVRDYQVLKLTLHLLEDDVTFYVLKEADSPKFRLAYAVLGDFYFDQPRADLFRNKDLSTNLLSEKDLEELLPPHNMAASQTLLDWLDELGLRASLGQKTIFEIINQDPQFLNRANPEFEVDSIKNGAIRGVISNTSVGGTIINQGKVIGRVSLNQPNKPASAFRDAVFISEEADVSDDPKMREAAAIVVTSGGPLAHAAIQARELGKPSLILDGTTFSYSGIKFEAMKGQPKRHQVMFQGEALTYVGGSEVEFKTAAVAEGDLVYVDAANGMFYLLAKSGETVTQKIFQQYGLWKKTQVKSPQTLQQILSAISNDNLFRAVIDELISSNFISEENLFSVLKTFLEDPSKKDTILNFFERKFRAEKTKFMKEIENLKEWVQGNNLNEIRGLYLILSRLGEQKKVLPALMQLIQPEGDHPFKENLEKLWKAAIQDAQKFQKDYQNQLLHRISRFLQETEIQGLKDQLAQNKTADMDAEKTSRFLSRISRFTENISLADFPSNKTYLSVHAALMQIFELEARLKEIRKEQNQLLASQFRVAGKDKLIDRYSRDIAGGKGANSAELQRALKILEGQIPANVRHPEGKVVLESQYQSWKSKNQPNDLTSELKRDLALSYRDVVDSQRKRILASLNSDSETSQDFKQYLEVILNVEFQDITETAAIDALILSWRAGILRLLQIPTLTIHPLLRRKLEVFGSVAARSSGIKEDSKAAAMAGQKETVLNVDSLKKLYQAVIAVWKSGAEAVQIDEMTNPETGVLAFSMDAVTSEPNIRITSAHGLTKGLVDSEGVPDPDIFVLKRNGAPEYKLIQEHIGNKSRAIVLDLIAGGIKTVEINELFPNDPGKARQPSLTKDQIQTVAKTADLLSQYFGYPLDIEGGFLGDELLIYQIRPITTLEDKIKEAKSLLKDARSEVRMVPEGADIEVSLKLDKTQLLANLETKWLVLQDAEKKLLKDLVNRIEVKLKVPKSMEKGERYDFFSSPSHSIFEDLFSPISTAGENNYQSRILNILQQMGLSPNHGKDVLLRYHVEALRLSYLGEGDHRVVDRVEIIPKKVKARSFTASLYHEYDANELLRAQQEQASLKKIQNEKVYRKVRSYFQVPYGISFDPNKKIIISYKSFLEGISMREFTGIFIPTAEFEPVNRSGQILLDAFKKLGTHTANVVRDTDGEYPPDAHLGNAVIAFGIRGARLSATKIGNIDLEEGLIRPQDEKRESQLAAAPLESLRHLLRSQGAVRKVNPAQFKPLAVAYLTGFFSAKYGLHLQGVDETVSHAYDHIMAPVHENPEDEIRVVMIQALYLELNKRFKPSHSRSEVRSATPRLRRTEMRAAYTIVLAAAPEAVRPKLPQVSEKDFENASEFLVTVTDVKAMKTLRQGIVKAISEQLANQAQVKAPSKLDATQDAELALQAKSVREKLEGILNVLIKNLDNDPAHFVIDLPAAGDKNSLGYYLQKVLAGKQLALRPILASTEAERGAPIISQTKKLLMKEGFNVIPDTHLKSTKTVMESHKKNRMAIITLDQPYVGRSSLPEGLIKIEHAEDGVKFDDLLPDERISLITLKLIEAVAIWLDKKPADLLRMDPNLVEFFQYQTHGANLIRFSLNRLRSEIRTAQAVASAA